MLVRDGFVSWMVVLGTESSYTSVRSKSKLAVGRWVHVAGVYDGEAIRLYIDGRLVGERAASGPRKMNQIPFLVGADPNREGRPGSAFSGDIDCCPFVEDGSVQREAVHARTPLRDGSRNRAVVPFRPSYGRLRLRQHETANPRLSGGRIDGPRGILSIEQRGGVPDHLPQVSTEAFFENSEAKACCSSAVCAMDKIRSASFFTTA